jgi:hypothetical protein
VDVSYADADNSNGTFGIDQVEVDIEKQLDDNTSIRADINYLPGTALEFDDLLEQGYLTYALAAGNGVDITIGKFNAPIGFELLDAPDMYQFSHALVFDNGLPTNLTGVMGAYKFNDQVDVAAYVVNGWDVSSSDINHAKTIGGRIGINAMEGLSVGVSVISGSEVATTDDKRTVFDVDVTATMVDKLIIGFEYNTGSEDNAGTATGEVDSEWTAYLLMGHYDLNDTYGVTARYDVFDDKGGSRIDSTDTFKEEQKAYTIAGTMVLGENAGAIVEYRHLKSDQNVFNGNTEDSADTVAVEFTYSF